MAKLLLMLSWFSLAGCASGLHDARHYYADGSMHEDYMVKVANDCSSRGLDVQAFMLTSGNELQVRDLWCVGPDEWNYRWTKDTAKGIGKRPLTHTELIAAIDECPRHHVLSMPLFDTAPSYVECL